MFGIKHNECVGFESRWKVTKVSSNGATQTDQFSVSEKGSITTTKSNIEVQTDENELVPNNPEVDMKKLAKWLEKIYPRVKRELDEANNSQAFKGYKLHEDSKEATARLLQNISLANTNENNKPARVSSIHWNQTGKTVAIAKNYEHETWCYHTGYVFIYTLMRDGKIPDLPRMKLVTETCVTSLKFHPKHPAVIAAATYSGGIIIWNIQKDIEECIVALANIHDEAVNQLSWINDTDLAKSIILATSSTDALLKLWNFSMNSCSLTLKARYKVKSPLFIGDNKNLDSSGNATNRTERGVVCFDFSKHFQDMFVVALEGGLVVQCSVLGTSKLKGHTDQEPLLDPVFKYYEPHKGEINTISFSPNRSEMFMTSGTDSEIRIYVIGQEEPAQIIFMKNLLNDLSFVPHEEKLVIGCGSNGVLEIFNLITGKAVPNVTKEIVKEKNLTILAINPSKTNILAVGNAEGVLQLWDVPWRAFSRN